MAKKTTINDYKDRSMAPIGAVRLGKDKPAKKKAGSKKKK